jgi:hypothetical protein
MDTKKLFRSASVFFIMKLGLPAESRCDLMLVAWGDGVILGAMTFVLSSTARSLCE